MSMEPDTEAAAYFQLELECMERFEVCDPYYEEWLNTIAASAAYEQEMNNADSSQGFPPEGLQEGSAGGAFCDLQHGRGCRFARRLSEKAAAQDLPSVGSP